MAVVVVVVVGSSSSGGGTFASVGDRLRSYFYFLGSFGGDVGDFTLH